MMFGHDEDKSLEHHSTEEHILPTSVKTVVNKHPITFDPDSNSPHYNNKRHPAHKTNNIVVDLDQYHVH